MKDKILKFLKENGFLLFLFICVGVVSLSTIYVVNKDIDSNRGDLLTKKQIGEIPKKLNEEEAPKDKENPPKNKIPKEEIQKDDIVKTDPKELDEEKTPPLEDLASSGEKEESKPKENIKSPKEELAQETFSESSILEDDSKGESQNDPKGFIMPVDGKIITEFSKDSLIYSETLDEWRAHTGIDIACEKGGKVKAPLDGSVKEVMEDPLWGKVIVLDHGSGLITRYANLGDTNMVKKGAKVKKGDHIAVIGKTADIEMLMESHLHFEMIKNGKLVDPRSIP